MGQQSNQSLKFTMSRRNLTQLVFAGFIYNVGWSTYIISSPEKMSPGCPMSHTFSICYNTNVPLFKESEIHLKLSSEIHVLEVKLNVIHITFLRISPYYYQSEDIFEKPTITCYLSGEINLDSIAKVIMNSIEDILTQKSSLLVTWQFIRILGWVTELLYHKKDTLVQLSQQ